MLLLLKRPLRWGGGCSSIDDARSWLSNRKAQLVKWRMIGSWIPLIDYICCLGAELEWRLLHVAASFKDESQSGKLCSQDIFAIQGPMKFASLMFSSNISASFTCWKDHPGLNPLVTLFGRGCFKMSFCKTAQCDVTLPLWLFLLVISTD